MTDSSRFGALPTDQWDSSLKSIVADMKGQPLNVHRLLANHPDLLNAWWNFRQYVVAGGELGQRNAELVILRTSVHRGSWYEWASHVIRGLASELPLADIERIFDGPTAAGWNEQDAVLLAAVDELDAHGSLPPASLESLGRYLDQKQILDLIAIHGTYVMLAMILQTWEVDLDEDVQQALPGTVTERRFTEQSGQA